jgi:flavodoxin
MKALIVYDSSFGNTEKVARAIGDTVVGQVARVGEVNPTDLKGFDLLIVGSPTHGGFQTKGIDGLLKALPALSGLKVAVFDTRARRTIFGYAAPKISQRLEKAGGKLVVPPEGFFVTGKQGPLEDGELDRAAEWVRHMQSAK